MWNLEQWENNISPNICIQNKNSTGVESRKSWAYYVSVDSNNEKIDGADIYRFNMKAEKLLKKGKM